MNSINSLDCIEAEVNNLYNGDVIQTLILLQGTSKDISRNKPSAGLVTPTFEYSFLNSSKSSNRKFDMSGLDSLGSGGSGKTQSRYEEKKTSLSRLMVSGNGSDIQQNDGTFYIIFYL